MSIDAITFVLDRSRSKKAKRAVLLVLAWHHNAVTGAIFPSEETIADEAGLSVRAVRDAFGALVDDGEIERERGRSYRYRIVGLETGGDCRSHGSEPAGIAGPGPAVSVLEPAVSVTGPAGTAAEPKKNRNEHQDDASPSEEERARVRDHLAREREARGFKPFVPEPGCAQ
jgi:Bacterial regulatory proteins, gntR family